MMKIVIAVTVQMNRRRVSVIHVFIAPVAMVSCVLPRR